VRSVTTTGTPAETPLEGGLLDVGDLVVGYGEAEILHGVSLSVPDGDLAALVGPNGAGKSTLVKAVVGLLRPSAGSIRFDGEEIAGLPTERLTKRGVVYLPQRDNVFRGMSVAENLKLAGHLKRTTRQRKIEDVLDLFPELTRLLSSMAGDLSGGERQMLAMARALVLEPRLLILDEPTAGLSPRVADLLFDKIVELKGRGVTLLIVEQNVEKVLACADVAYVLAAGENRFRGSGPELLASPEMTRLYLGG
jgi:ABC-type branched-subunit amino acid transport system ATPase component